MLKKGGVAGKNGLCHHLSCGQIPAIPPSKTDLEMIFGIRDQRLENKLHHDFKLMHETFRTAEIYRVILPENLDLSKINLSTLLNLD